MGIKRTDEIVWAGREDSLSCCGDRGGTLSKLLWGQRRQSGKLWDSCGDREDSLICCGDREGRGNCLSCCGDDWEDCLSCFGDTVGAAAGTGKLLRGHCWSCFGDREELWG